MKKKIGLSALAFLFMITGAVLTLENYGLVNGVSKLWPLAILLMGLGFAVLFFNGKMKDPALIWAGTFFVLLSAFFLYLNQVSWRKLASLWTVFLGIVGISFLCTFIFTRKRIFAYFSILFIMLFLALYLVFTVSLRLWPMSMVVFGVSLLIINYFNVKNEKGEGYEH